MGAETFRTIRERGGFGCPFGVIMGYYPLQLPLAQGERWVPGVYPTCVREVGGVFSMMKTFALFVESFQYDENFSYFWGEF